MDRLLIAALLVANLALFLYLCRLAVIVRRGLTDVAARGGGEDRVDELQRALADLADDVRLAGADAVRAIDERQERLTELADACARTIGAAREVAGDLATQCARAEAFLGKQQYPEEPEDTEADEPADEDDSVRVGFARRNERVFTLADEGLSDGEIAKQLDLSVGEVEFALGLRRGLGLGPGAGS
jgi:hypothetical protein